MPRTYSCKVFNLQWRLLQPPCWPDAPSAFNYSSNAPVCLFCPSHCLQMTVIIIPLVSFCNNSNRWQKRMERLFYFFFLHNLDYGIVPCTASQIEHKNASTTQLRRDKSMSWIFFFFFFNASAVMCCTQLAVCFFCGEFQ